MGFKSSTSTPLPYEQRHAVLHYENAEGTLGETRYPINYDELYNLKGRLLTLIDATNGDAQQRKALKDLVWQMLQAWMLDIERAADGCVLPDINATGSHVPDDSTRST